MLRVWHSLSVWMQDGRITHASFCQWMAIMFAGCSDEELDWGIEELTEATHTVAEQPPALPAVPTEAPPAAKLSAKDILLAKAAHTLTLPVALTCSLFMPPACMTRGLAAVQEVSSEVEPPEHTVAAALRARRRPLMWVRQPPWGLCHRPAAARAPGAVRPGVACASAITAGALLSLWVWRAHEAGVCGG